MTKISIITPSYNQGQYIEQTITSVLDQGYPNLEYLVFDGGSTDNTVEIIKKYEKHISYWESKKDKGQSDAINKGFHKATGEIINWLNSDDYYEKDTLYKVASVFNDPAINVYGGRSHVFGIGKEYMNYGSDLYANNLFKTVGWARIDQPETFFRHSVLKEIGYLNDFLHFTMDKEMWMRYLLKYGLSGIYKSNDVLVHYRLHDNSKSVSLQKGFTEETYNLYYTFAKWFSLINFSSFLESRFPVNELSLKGYEGLLDKEKAYNIINYYFLQQALFNYAQDNYPLSKDFITQIDASLLTIQDKEELNKVQTRMKMPRALKHVFHFIKQLYKAG